MKALSGGEIPTRISDGTQSLDLAQFQKMMRELQPYIALWNESRKVEVAAAAASH